MRLAYAGTAPFAALVLGELLKRDTPICVVVTRPDKPRGRHGTPQPSAVKELALEHGLPVMQPDRLSGEALRVFLGHAPDVLVVCAHGEIMSSDVLTALPTLVVHPSAVPRWRGAAPVERALMAGEMEIGVTTLRMTPGVDEGPVGDLRFVHVPPDADAGRAYQLLAAPAAESVLAIVRALESGSVIWRPQRGAPTYAKKLQRSDRGIDWQQPARAVVDQVRALSPAIGAVTSLAGREVIVWRATSLAEQPLGDGTRIVLPAGRGWVELLEVQLPGKRRMSVEEFLRGAGSWLGHQ